MEETRHGNIIKGVEPFKIASALMFTESSQSQETSSGLQRLSAALFLFMAPMPKKIEGLISTPCTLPCSVKGLFLGIKCLNNIKVFSFCFMFSSAS